MIESDRDHFYRISETREGCGENIPSFKMLLPTNPATKFEDASPGVGEKWRDDLHLIESLKGYLFEKFEN
jgi:hypothetical protein